MDLLEALRGEAKAARDLLSAALAEPEALDWLGLEALESVLPVEPAPAPAPAPRGTTSGPSLAEFAEAVVAVARVSPARYSPRDVFISGVWREMQPILRWSEAEFKAALVEAHRAGLLRLARADLVAAMDPREVAASETRYGNFATFHFVEVDR